jgi:hypothetical protein
MNRTMLFAASSDSMRARRAGSSDMGAVRETGDAILRRGMFSIRLLRAESVPLGAPG